MQNEDVLALKKLGNKELLDQTVKLVELERNTGIQILHRLKEINRRRLYAELGFSSLFKYLRDSLKYPESTACWLIKATELLAEVPEVEEKIQSGELSVSTVSQVQSYCKAQKRENNLQFTTED